MSHRRARLEEGKKMVVDGECEQQSAQGAGDRQGWARLRTAADTTCGVRSSLPQHLAGPKWRSSHRVQCLSESVPHMQQQLINESSRSHSTTQQRVTL
jgi:hypothetical protein